MTEHSKLVYSTDGGRVAKAQPHNRRIEPAKALPAGPRIPDDGVVRVSREKKGHGGKTMTVITGLPGVEADLDALLKRLKSTIGTGGTREGAALYLQGDVRERLVAELAKIGHRPKLAGG
jgi:translation initiation factor 1